MVMTAAITGVLIAIVAVIGIRFRGGRRVGNTQMMTVARVVLAAVGLTILFLALRHSSPSFWH